MRKLEFQENNNNPQKLSLSQKIGVVALVLLTFLVVIGWMFSMNRTLTGPLEESVSRQSDLDCPEGDCFEDEDQGSIFDDSDTLFGEADEFEFILDYESDSIDDFLGMGTSSDFLDQGMEPLDFGDFGDTENLDALLQGEGDPDTLRQILSQMGMDEDILEQIDDDHLMEIYHESLEEDLDGGFDQDFDFDQDMDMDMGDGDISDFQDSDAGDHDLELILGGEMDPDTLRQILLESGLDQEALDQISDEELMEQYEKEIEDL